MDHVNQLHSNIQTNTQQPITCQHDMISAVFGSRLAGRGGAVLLPP